MTKRFEVLTQSGHYRYGKDLVTNGATIEPGMLVKLDTGGSTVSLCGSTETPFGFAYGERVGVYRPTTRVFADAEKLVVVKGRGLALISADFFTTGSLPGTVNSVLYTTTGGLMTTTQGSETKVGRYLYSVTLTTPTGGTGSSESLALIEFDIPA